ncbi:MAG TPA: MxaK protein [Methylococcus sp.]|nr:MxaK protein [Methylococcus sp.]
MNAAWQARLAAILALSSLVLAGEEAWRWHSAAAANAAISSLLSGHDLPPERIVDAPLFVLLARALYLGRQDRYEEAVELLRYLESRGDACFRSNVYFDQGNLHLRRALDAVAQAEFTRAAGFAELAKEAYRRSLQIEPTNWDAKYNLEVAMRLSPDFERATGEAEEEATGEESRLWTTLPGFPRGLP